MKATPMQRGFSLIELMVGLLVSLIGILSMVAIYQQAGQNGTEMKVGAYLDGQIHVGLLAADRLLQNAGFHSADPALATASYDKHLTFYKNASIDLTGAWQGELVPEADITSAGAAGNAIIWLESSADGQRYLGLFSDTENGGLWQLSGNSLASLAGWQVGTSLIAPSPVADDYELFDGVAEAVMTLVRADCSPFGMADTGMTGLYKLQLSVQPYAGGNAQLSETCLGNFQAQPDDEGADGAS